MRKLKYLATVALLALCFSACTNNKRDSATIGGTRDTMNAVEGSNSGDVGAASSDSSINRDKTNTADSTSQGNVNPSGHPEKGGDQ